jgi:hypothetical protein
MKGSLTPMRLRIEFRINPVIALLLLLAPLFMISGCGSGGSSSTPVQPTDSLSVSVSSATVTVPQGGSIGRVTANITRTSTTGAVTLTVSGMPSGAVVTIEQQPGYGNTGTIALNPQGASSQGATSGTYPLTVSATDGMATATTPISFVINSGIVSQFASPVTWSSTGPLISAIPDPTHSIVSVKDPSAFYYNNQWNVYATTADTSGNWNMVYLHFTDWSSAAAAQPYYMDATPGLSGYHCAPEVFYFTPQKTWYLIYQSGQPQYSTTSDPTQPATWTAPQNFFASQPASVSNWLDFMVVCDSANCYLFFSGDNGIFYRSQTAIGSFPQGFSEPVAVMQAANAGDLFESAKVYTLEGLNQYLMIVEAMGPSGTRYYRSFIAPSLDGSLTPISGANSWQDPFAGINDVTFNAGVGNWTNDISHGELLRVGYDETMTIDPANLQFLYQGVNPANNAPNYSQIPYQLGLLTRTN